MLFLWVFGDNVEDAMGHFKFLFFYIACAAADLEAAGMSAPAPRAMPCGAGKTGAEGRNPPSKTIRIRLRCRHPKSIDSAHAAAGVVQTFPRQLHERPLLPRANCSSEIFKLVCKRAVILSWFLPISRLGSFKKNSQNIFGFLTASWGQFGIEGLACWLVRSFPAIRRLNNSNIGVLAIFLA
eukprot:gene9767-13177_t